MKKRLLSMLLVILATVNMVACGAVEEIDNRARSEHESSSEKHKNQEADDDDDDDVSSTKEHDAPESDYEKCAMMVYIVGSNLESGAGYATLDIEEMIDGEYDEDLMDVYLCTGGSRKWQRDDISEDEIAVYKLNDGDLDKLDVIDNATMSNPDTLKQFINTVYADTDSDCYNLVLWNHGAGALVGYGQDEYDLSTALLMPDLRNAIGNSDLIQNGDRFEFIGFDACLMGMMEVAYTLSDYSNYLIASEEYTPGSGWDYTSFGRITEDGNFNGENMAQIIIDDFEDFNTQFAFYKPEYLLTCMDLSKTKQLVDSFDAFIEETHKILDDGNYADIAKARDKTKGFGQINGAMFYDSVDLYNFAEKMSRLCPDEADALKESIEDMVVYSRTNIGNAHGISFYFPHDNKLYLDEWYSEYQFIGISKVYEDFMQDYAYQLTGENIANWDIEDIIPSVVGNPVEIDPSADFDGQYFIELTMDQISTYSDSKVLIWKKYEDMHDMYALCVSQRNTELLDDGKLVCDFNDKVFYLQNGAGEEQQCTLQEIERTDDYVMYQSSLMVFPAEGGVFHVNVNVKVDDEHPDGEIINITKMEEVTEDNLFPQAEVYELQEGDNIQTFIFSRQVTFNPDGSVAPFSEWISDTVLVGGNMKYDGSLSITCHDESDDDFFCLFLVKDIQGNLYTSGAFIPEERSREGAYITSEANDNFTIDDFYDSKSKTGVIYDVYREQVATIALPDKYKLNEDYSYKERWDIYDRDGNRIEIDSDMGDSYTQYMNTGAAPDSFSIKNLEIEVKKKYNYGKHEIWYVEETNEMFESEYFVIPYTNCYGDQRYMKLLFRTQDMSQDEMVDLIKEMIVK